MQSHEHRRPTLGVDEPLPTGFPLGYDFPGATATHHIQVGETTVHIRYRAGGPSLQQKMTQLCQEDY